MGKKILVMMSSYNGEKYIRDQVSSIMEQDVSYDVKLVIRDDGSSDRTIEIIESLQGEYPGRIELIQDKNIGSNASFFTLMRQAEKCDFYAISDQDDVWMKDKLRVAVEHLEKENREGPLLYSCRSYLVGDDMKPYGVTRKQERPFTLYNTIIQDICPGHNQVFNYPLLERVNQLEDPAAVYVYDSWIMNTAMLYGKIIFDNEPHTYYRQHGKNQMGAGAGLLDQMKTSLRHIQAGDGKKYSRQIRAFLKQNYTAISEQERKEMERFLDSDRFGKRLVYLLKGKVYRQRRIETVAFYLAYVLGKYTG